MKFIYFILILFSSTLLIQSQNMHIYDINSDDYPLIKAKFYVTDSENNQLKNFQTEDFKIQENQILRFVNEIKCSNDDIFNKISTILTIDVSRSMTGERLDWVKAAATKWVKAADSLNEETAITTFSDNALLYTDFINDSTILSNIIDTLEIRDGTNYKNAFLDPFSGALDVARRAKYLPVIIFLTDGVGLSDFSQKEIIEKAKQIGAIIYAISIDISLPREMKQVSEATGGQYFELINSQEKLTEAYNTIRQIAVNTVPCEISWFTSGCILGRQANITYSPYSITKEISYDAPDEKFPEFTYLTDEFAVFECENPNTYLLRLQAKNDKIEINDIVKVGGANVCSEFTTNFVNRSPPFTLEKDEILEIEINYSPTDSKFKFCEFKIEASSCLNSTFYAVSNCLNSPPSNVLIDVIRPDGGEVFKASTQEQILWSGTSKDKDLRLEYSLDSGQSWNLINSGKFYNNYKWNVANAQSNKCLVKVKQMSNNAGRLVYSTNTDSTIAKRISWNNSGNTFAIISDTNSVKFFNSITGEKINEIFIETDTSRILDVQFLPDGARLYVTTEVGLYLMSIINKKTTFINELTGEIEISNDDSFITITNKDSLAIFNLITKNIDNIIRKNNINSKITGTAISKSSNRIVYCTSTNNFQDSLYIITKGIDWANIISESFFDNDTSSTYSYTNIDWSFDDNYIITTSKIKNLQFLDIWDVKSKKKIEKEFDPSTSDITDLATSEYDNFIITVDAGFQVIVWQIVNDGDKVVFSKKYNFKSPIIVNDDIEWSPDGTRFAVGSSSNDKSAKFLSVYSLKSYPEVEAISDSTFTIIKEIFSVNPIDLGQELIGLTKDSTIRELLLYNYNYLFNVDSVNITGIDKDNFSVSNSPNLPLLFNNTNQADFNFSFTPIREGVHNAVLNIYSQYGKSTSNITAEGVRPFIELEDYNFGEVLITKDSTITKFAIRNNGSSDLEIESIFIVGPSDQFYSLLDISGNILNNINNVTLNPNQELELTVIFAPLLPRLENARIKIIYKNKNDNQDIKYINLYGEGINPEYLSDSNILFDDILCNNTQTKEITIYNVGNGTLKLYNFFISSNNYKLLDFIDQTYEINERDSLKFLVEFNPNTNGQITDSLIINTNELEENFRKIYFTGRKLDPSFSIEGNNQLIGVPDNQIITDSFQIINTGKIQLKWNPPYVSKDGKITVTSIIQKSTLVGDTSVVNFRFEGGQKGESFSLKFAPSEPDCADSIEIRIDVKNTKATLFTDFETEHIIVCEDSFSFKIPIANSGEEPLDISNIRFENNDNLLFNVNKKKLKLLENESDTVIVTFTSESPGIFNTDFIIISNDSKSDEGKFIRKLKVKKEISSFEIIENEVDFIYIGLTNPGPKQFTIKNNGTVPIRWNILPLINFNILNVTPQVALPGESSIVTLAYNGPNDSSSVNQLLVADSCGTLDSVALNIITANNGYAKLQLDKVRKRIGEVFDYKITLVSANKLEEAGAVSITGILKFNHSLMTSLELNSNINNTVRAVPFEITDLNEGFEFNIKAEALWGDDSCSTIAIDSLKVNGNTTDIDLEYTIGSICLTDLCKEGGTRLIDLSKELGATIKLNESNSNNILNLDLEVIEKGYTNIDLINTNGSIVKKITNEYLSPGLKQYSADISNISNGVYFIKIETPSITITKKLIIVR